MDTGLGSLGSFRINRYAGTTQRTDFHRPAQTDYYGDDDGSGSGNYGSPGGGGGYGGEGPGGGGGGIGGVASFGRNLSTCFGGKILNSGPKRVGMGRGYVGNSSQGRGDSYYGPDNGGSLAGPGLPFGSGNRDGFQVQPPASSGYFSSPSSFGGGGGGGIGGTPTRGPTSTFPDKFGTPTSGRVGGMGSNNRSGGGSIGSGSFRFGTNTTPPNRSFGQEYTSTVSRNSGDFTNVIGGFAEDMDLEPPMRHHSSSAPSSFSSTQNPGRVFRRGGGIRGSQNRQGGRTGPSKFPRTSNESSGGGGGRIEPLLSVKTSASAKDFRDKSGDDKPATSSPSNIGVHLDITPPIFKEMTNRVLGDKVFIMIPKQAKSVMDVKIHVANLLGIEVYLVNFFINGFRIPENEDVEAFACISKNSLVQVAKPGYKPHCDLSKFSKAGVKAPNAATSDGDGDYVITVKSKTDSEKEANTPGTPEHEKTERKRRQNYMEPSLLDPPSRRPRHSDPSTNVTTLTPIIMTSNPQTSSPQKKTVIEIVLSDDDNDDDEDKEVSEVNQKGQPDVVIDEVSTNTKNNSAPESQSASAHSSGSEKLVIEEGMTTTTGNEEKNAMETNQTNQNQTQGSSGHEEFTVEDEVGSLDDDSAQNTASESAQGEGTTIAMSNMTTQNQEHQKTENQQSVVERHEPEQSTGGSGWVNAAGQVVARVRKPPESSQESQEEIIELSSPEGDKEEDDDNGSSTTFDEDSNEPFFSITAIQSIPVGVFKSIEEEADKITTKPSSQSIVSRQSPRKNQSQGNFSQQHENWDLTSQGQSDTSQQASSSSTSFPSSLRNPMAKVGTTLLVDISNETETSEHVTEMTKGSQQSVTTTELQGVRTEEPSSKPGGDMNETVTTSVNPEKIMKKTSPIDEINQIKCGSLILYQVMESIGSKTETSAEACQSDDTGATKQGGGERQLSDVKCCKVIGLCGLKLTLEPVADGGEGSSSGSGGTTKETESESDTPTTRKFVFMDFQDMINIQEVIED